MSLGIPASVHGLFPKSASKTKTIAMAWHPERSTADRPGSNGSEGCEPIGDPATRVNLERLAARGFTHVNIQASGVANSLRDASIASLLA